MRINTDAPKDAIARIKLQIVTAESEEEKAELYTMLKREMSKKKNKGKLWGNTESWA